MMVDKERVREYYRQLKADFSDLCHEDIEYVVMWIEKARNLRLVGAWWHYKVLIAQAKRYICNNCPTCLQRFERLLKCL